MCIPSLLLPLKKKKNPSNLYLFQKSRSVAEKGTAQHFQLSQEDSVFQAFIQYKLKITMKHFQCGSNLTGRVTCKIVTCFPSTLRNQSRFCCFFFFKKRHNMWMTRMQFYVSNQITVLWIASLHEMHILLPRLWLLSLDMMLTLITTATSANDGQSGTRSRTWSPHKKSSCEFLCRTDYYPHLHTKQSPPPGCRNLMFIMLCRNQFQKEKKKHWRSSTG